ncbi:Competence/damage inducible protein CinA [Pseudomonas syringae pv. viburni]|uniref:Competence/damage inducible protein CinA n=1 Tax=Pseudomonas syringae pv. viburni TaxID=251703 RepID=A0A0Q0CCZ2_9PSED|nr:Competence/damage inducible protein CinA [Pseudomonas syringae pv. viburni]
MRNCMKNKRARDSVNGRFIPLDEARKRPRETTVETVKKPERRKSD